MNTDNKISLKKYLSKLNVKQFKAFYTIIVHYWMEYKHFIGQQNFLNLWCELNQLCHEVDESFPDPYDDHDLIKSYCQANPYYFIDILDLKLVINLFCQHLDDKLDIVTVIAQKLDKEGIKATYDYINNTMFLSENTTESTVETENYLEAFS